MPYLRKLARRRVNRKRKGAKKRYNRRRPLKLGRSMNANKDYATVTEVTEREIGGGEGNFITHCLGDFPRAKAVAKNFRLFRCKKVEVEFVPYANVFAPGSSFPELFSQVDRTAGLINGAALPLPTKASMEARGCMPQKLTSIIKKFYIPSVLRNENMFVQYQPTVQADGPPETFSRVQTVATNIAAVSSTPVFNKWYMVQAYPAAPPTAEPLNPIGSQQIKPSIDPLSLQYYGMSYFLDQPVAQEAVVGKVVIKVHWQFKQPLYPASAQNSTYTGGEGWETNPAH